MRISQHLYQFPHHPALLIVAGARMARIYQAYQGAIELIHTITVERIHFSDREGHFKTRSPGRVVRSGAVYEDPSIEETQVFLEKLATTLHQEADTLQKGELYLFTPQHMRNLVLKTIPRSCQRRIRYILEGNVHEAHPFVLLQKIEQRRNETLVTPTSGPAARILRRSNTPARTKRP